MVNVPQKGPQRGPTCHRSGVRMFGYLFDKRYYGRAALAVVVLEEGSGVLSLARSLLDFLISQGAGTI